MAGQRGEDWLVHFTQQLAKQTLERKSGGNAEFACHPLKTKWRTGFGLGKGYMIPSAGESWKHAWLGLKPPWFPPKIRLRVSTCSSPEFMTCESYTYTA